MKIKTLIVLLGVFLILFGIFYKIYEYNLLNQLIKSDEGNFNNEIALIEENSKEKEKQRVEQEIYKKEKKAKKQDDTIPFFTSIQSIVVNTDKLTEYLKLLEQNSNKFEPIDKKTNLLLGDKRILAKQIVQKTKDYYKNEIKLTQIEIVRENLFLNIFEALYDNTTAYNHLTTKWNLSRDKFTQSLSDISSLEKYSKNDFAFKNEAEIKNYFPYGLEVLNRYKDSLRSYYLISKDYASERDESALYKARKFADTAVELKTVDWDRLGQEQQDKIFETKREISELLSQKITLLDQLSIYKSLLLPLKKNILFPQFNLELCYFYNYKTQIYYGIRLNYPEATSTAELINNLSIIAPKTDKLDEKFDNNSLVLSNTKEKIEFVCEDKQTNKKYYLTIPKVTN